MRICRKMIFSAVNILFAALAKTTSRVATNARRHIFGKSEIEQYFKRAPADAVSDQQVRAVNAGKTNIDIGVVYRGKETAGGAVAEHDLVSEVYHIIDGSATLVTGSDIVDVKRRAADDRAVRMLNGPGGNGVSIRNGVTYELKPGDVVIIPAGVGHWFTRSTTIFAI